MKNEMSPVTSTYFVTLLKAYLNGNKTRKEVMQELDSVLPSPGAAAMYPNRDLTQTLLQAAADMDENYYHEVIDQLSHTADTAPVRTGLLHQLEAVIAGEITRQDLLDWATWHLAGEDFHTGLATDIAVDYFCHHQLAEYFEDYTPERLKEALAILRKPGTTPLQQKIALVLLFEKEQQRFLFYLGEYNRGQQSIQDLDVYLLHTFGMDHHSYPYMDDISIIRNDPSQLPALLHKAKLQG